MRPLIDDHTRPAQPNGAPVPVIDKTNIEGDRDFILKLSPEPGEDAFTHWQRQLQDELGLSLRVAKREVEILTVGSADKLPTQN